MRRSPIVAMVLVVLAVLSAGCSRTPALGYKSPVQPASGQAITVEDFSIVPAAGWEVSHDSPLTKVLIKDPTDHDGFRNNLNVLVQARSTTIDAYRDQTRKELDKLNGTVVSEEKTSVGGRDAYRVVYTAKMLGRELRFVGTAIPANGKVYLVTGTARTDDFGALEPAFDAMTYSLQIK